MLNPALQASPARAGGFSAFLSRCAAVLRDWRRRRQARRTARALALLDDRTLRDLGFDRSEIAGLSAEQHGLNDPSYVRVLVASRYH